MTPTSSSERLRAAVHDYLRRQAAGTAESLPEFVSASGFAREVVDELLAELQAPAGEDGPQDFGRYELRELLGRGGMGTVHKALDRQLERTVALKRIRAELLASADIRRRFDQEVKAAAALDHANICRIFDAGEHDGCPFLVMQHVRGETLAAKVKAARRPDAAGAVGAVAPLTTCLEWIEKVARGLHHAHERGLIHRDVKPSNILIRDDGEPFLVDFGLARPLDEAEPLTTVGLAPGTFRYMSPEQLQPRGRALDRRTDVFSLGLVLAELVSLRHPFVADSDVEVVHAILTAAPRLEAMPGPDGPLRVVLETALAKDPGTRYPTAAAFADDLARVRRDEAIVGGRQRAAARVWSWGRRHPWRALGAAAGVAGSLFAAWSLWGELGAARVTSRQAAQATAALAALAPGQGPEAALAAAVAAASLRQDHALDTLLWRGLDACGKAYGLDRRNLHGHQVMTRPALDARGERMAFLSDQGQLLVLRIADGELLASVPAHVAEVAGAAPQSVAFRPGHDELFTGGRDGRIKVWSTTDWRESRGLELVGGGREARVAALAVSADGRWLAVGGEGGEVLLQDLEDPAGRVRRSSAGTLEAVAGLRFSPDGRQVALLTRTAAQRFGESLGVSVLDCGSGETRWSRRFDRSALLCCEWHPGGRWLAAGSVLGEALVMDAATDGATVFSHTVTERDRYVRWCGFDPAGQHLLIGAGSGLVVMEWADGTGSPRTIVRGHPRAVATLAFAPGGTHAAALFRDGSLGLIDARDWRLLRVFASPPYATNLLSLDWAAAAGRIVGGRNYDVDVWHVSPDAMVPTLHVHRQSVESLDLHPDGQVVLTASGDGVVAETGLRSGSTTRRELGVPLRAARYSPGGTRYCVVDSAGQVRVFDRQGEARRQTPGGLARWIDDDRLLVANGRDALLLDLRADRLTELHRQRGEIMALAVDVERRMAYTGGADRDIWGTDFTDPGHSARQSTPGPYDMEHGSLVGCIHGLAIWPATHRLLVSTINTNFSILTCDPADPAQRLRDIQIGVFGGLIAVHPDGQRAACSDYGFGYVSWLDLDNLDPTAVSTHQDAHSQVVTALRFSRSGRLCLSASLDGTVKLWDATTRSVRSVLRLDGCGIADACFSADEQEFLTADSRGQVKRWPVDPLPRAERYLQQRRQRGN